MDTRRKWFLRHYWPMPIILLGLLVALATGNWLLAAMSLLLVITQVTAERGARWSYQRGWWEGQILQASVMTSDLPEERKRQLLSQAPEPWEVKITKEVSHDG